MPGDDKVVGRTVAVTVLMLVAVVALRGYLPGAQPAAEPAEPRPSGGAGSLVAVIAMLAVSMSVIAIAILTQSRSRMPAPGVPERRRRGGWDTGGVPWRMLLIAATALFAWLTLLAFLARWMPQFGPDGLAPPDAPPDTPTDAGGVGPPEAADGPAEGGDVFGYLAGATALLIVLSVIATATRRRTAPGEAPPDTAAAEPAEPDLARATERGLAEIGDPSRDPREAIIACYVAMERELEKTPESIPQASDTPSEVLARAVRSQTLHADSAQVLVDLFEEARFSPHVMDEGHRADAVRALRLVQQDLQCVP
ncbi:DUF4129 domain-containing protein [Mycobacterium sp. Y57]|uniref:DUF4129 domain-containing protein n=1 Tax=Mycolicibacterium xanthum TaxID=2796469 RepID=UPI001C854063|nr:DUF4129 domain-containing protein [Mycolicibacterium xanthum]MBX7431700.1 DUF4129 domain-containing protein [Mycolicibacterium xanthum]